MAPTIRFNEALAGRYTIVREVGSGGMATVYLAEDLKHHRKVAIKVLRPDLSASVGAERFLREIQIAAQLQHPNILPLLDSGEADGQLYYVMPFVEGQSLRQRLGREHELPVGETVRLLFELADALAHAHAHGVVHRDIKPDNIMLSGRHALIADFGVARALSDSTGADKITSIGIALGTPSYMSPEQATGDPLVDHRSDIYALGILGYELLAGRLPFSGTSPQQILAAHVTETPDPVSKHRPGISPALELAVMRCLAKRAADRWQTSDELLAALEPLATPSGGMSPTSSRLEPVRKPSRLPVWAAGFAVVLLGLTAVAYETLRTTPPTLVLGRSNQLTTDVGLQIHPAISPDGKFVAYASGNAARMRIFIRPVGGGRIFPLGNDSSAVETNPRWSPDGSKILFLINGGLAVAPALGGEATVLAQPVVRAPIRTADWSPDGTEIVFVRLDTMLVMSADGQKTRFLSAGDAEGYTDCRWSPKGNVIACVAGNPEGVVPGTNFGNSAPSGIDLISVEKASVTHLTDRTTADVSPEWAHEGRQLFFISNRDGPRDIYGVAVDAAGRARGAPVKLTTGLNARSLSIAGNGRLAAYSVYESRANLWALPIPSGAPVNAESATQLTHDDQTVEMMRPSPDGHWLAFDADRNGHAQLYRMPLAGGPAEQLTHESSNVFAPAISPDGKWIAYHSWRNGTRDVDVRPVTGGPVEHVTDSPGQESYPVWAPDGRRLAYIDQFPRFTVLVTERSGPGHWSPGRFVANGFRPEWSPDGTSLAFTTVDTTRLLVSNSDGTGLRTIYTATPGSPHALYAIWSADGKSLYFKSHDAAGASSIWSIGANGGTPRLLVRFPDPARTSNRRDFAADAKRFYFTIEDRQANIWVADVNPH